MQSERSFIACTEADFPKEERPPCPDCGAYHTLANGSARWICGDCGRQWKKVFTPRTVNNPPCFWCGGHTYKVGVNYQCMDCGRSKAKHLVKKAAL